jgi:uncharacterized protein YdaU (DUF1376 family)
MSGAANGNGAKSHAASQFAKMPWYPRDFASSTRGWPVTARGIYRELLDVQWDMGSLPENPRELQMIAGATSLEWKRAWPLLEPKFPVGEGGRRRNARLESHRLKALNTTEQRRAGAAKTNAGRGISWGAR